MFCTARKPWIENVFFGIFVAFLMLKMETFFGFGVILCRI
nr:MAG TPA: hypothetical protein [Caudoviricetes sp.]